MSGKATAAVSGLCGRDGCTKPAWHAGLCMTPMLENRRQRRGAQAPAAAPATNSTERSQGLASMVEAETTAAGVATEGLTETNRKRKPAQQAQAPCQRPKPAPKPKTKAPQRKRKGMSTDAVGDPPAAVATKVSVRAASGAAPSGAPRENAAQSSLEAGEVLLALGGAWSRGGGAGVGGGAEPAERGHDASRATASSGGDSATFPAGDFDGDNSPGPHPGDYDAATVPKAAEAAASSQPGPSQPGPSHDGACGTGGNRSWGGGTVGCGFEGGASERGGGDHAAAAALAASAAADDTRGGPPASGLEQEAPPTLASEICGCVGGLGYGSSLPGASPGPDGTATGSAETRLPLPGGQSAARATPLHAAAAAAADSDAEDGISIHSAVLSSVHSANPIQIAIPVLSAMHSAIPIHSAMHSASPIHGVVHSVIHSAVGGGQCGEASPSGGTSSNSPNTGGGDGGGGSTCGGNWGGGGNTAGSDGGGSSHTGGGEWGGGGSAEGGGSSLTGGGGINAVGGTCPRYTNAQNASLLELRLAGRSWREISGALGRTDMSVQKRWAKLQEQVGIYMYICIYVCVYIYIYIYISIYLSIYLSIYIYLSISFSLSLYIYKYIYIYIYIPSSASNIFVMESSCFLAVARIAAFFSSQAE